MIRITAPSKVNLFLRILAREDSGFHQLETLFQALALGDTLTLEESGEGISLEAAGAAMGSPEENLAFRAARAFLEAAELGAGVRIRLEKRIPVQGGLGGGSSDAAAVLRAMDLLFPDRVEAGDLLALSATLGSDVPFFLGSSPLSLAWGRGERLFPLPALPSRPVVVAIPPMGVNTGEAYAMLAHMRKEDRRREPPASLTPETLSSWDSIPGIAVNHFEAVVLTAHPLLARLKEALSASGADLTLLSGSGSTLFSVFRRDETAREALGDLEAHFPDSRFILTHTLERFPDSISDPGVEP